MKRAAILAIAAIVILPNVVGGQVGASLREQVTIRESLLDTQLGDLVETREELRAIWSRFEQQTGNLLDAQRQGESVESLRLHDADLRKTEAEVLAILTEMQQQRGAMLENRSMIAAIEAEVQRLAAGIGEASAPLAGSWQLVVEPGQEGVAYLQQQGTLVSGTYSLSGGFNGSFRGTFVAGKVRLERIDSQYGFAAIFYGRLVGHGRNARLQGNWEATQLASGLPAMGSWTATRIVEGE
ncbi:MAG: hypothetical protein LJE93_10145 [Acidobacteria bacterium]|jgi:hypothetical protein|nr:hypothetical protein [Acidobacteriota bacterium]